MLRNNKVLYFTRHTVYTIGALPSPLKPLEGPNLSDEVLTEIGKRAGFEVECTRNGEVFDGDLSQYGGFVFFTSGSMKQLMAPESTQGSPPISERGAENFYAALKAGAGFVAFRNAMSCSEEILGISYNGHAPTQNGRMIVTSPDFPGMRGAGESFIIRDPWYTFKNYQKDLHVVLVLDTELAKTAQIRPEQARMHEKMSRPDFPSTWARLYGNSRVFYTSMGNFDETWKDPIFQNMVQGAISWTLGTVDFDPVPNIDQAAPHANQTSW
ncbi:MAG: ThuA domain-containing protein [Armatimonadetes bacterium]|nr:ThuA domain-containing protein [Armatimonadota bacterium]